MSMCQLKRLRSAINSSIFNGHHFTAYQISCSYVGRSLPKTVSADRKHYIMSVYLSTTCLELLRSQ